MTTSPWSLIGGHQSPYVAKVRAYLRYRRIPFDEILPSRAFYKAVVVPKTGAAFIPVLHDTETDTYVAESSEILDYVEGRLAEGPSAPLSIHPETPQQRLVSYLMELFMDEGMGPITLHYRWANVAAGGVNDAFMQAEWSQMMAPEERDEEKLKGVLQRSVYGNAKNMAAGAGITAEMVPSIENRFAEILQALNTHFRDHEYLLGSKACWGDFALGGHLYNYSRDPSPGAMIAEKYPFVRSYVERCHQGSVRPPNGFLATGPGREFLADDAIPPAVLSVLAMFFEDVVPYLAECVKAAVAWKQGKGQSHSGPLPRGIAVVPYSIKGVSSKRGAPFHIMLKLQRVLDQFDPKSTAQFLAQFPNGEILARLKEEAPAARMEHEPGKFFKFHFQASKL